MHAESPVGLGPCGVSAQVPIGPPLWLCQASNHKLGPAPWSRGHGRRRVIMACNSCGPLCDSDANSTGPGGVSAQGPAICRHLPPAVALPGVRRNHLPWEPVPVNGAMADLGACVLRPGSDFHITCPACSAWIYINAQCKVNFALLGHAPVEELPSAGELTAEDERTASEGDATPGGEAPASSGEGAARGQPPASVVTTTGASPSAGQPRSRSRSPR